MLTYEINDRGYVVFRDGAVLITQETVPGVAGNVRFTDDAHKQLCAEAAIAENAPAGSTTEG